MPQDHHQISAGSSAQADNRLIWSLPRRQASEILERCLAVDLHDDVVLCDSGQPLQGIYFPTTAVISMVAAVDGHRPMELGMIGCEGALGANLAPGVDADSLKAIVRVSGSALRMSAAQVRQARVACPALLPTLNGYLYELMAQFAQTGVCARFHRIEVRLARWLLMTSDRAPLGPMRLTHGFLSQMLGVRRSAITIAAGGLQKRGLIRYRRGCVTILDRAGLRASACGCYRSTADDGWPGTGFASP